MAGIFHPSRGGTRGGQDQFNWEDVKTDKDREYYLGHSLKASVGRWQEGKDLIWYTRDRNKTTEENEADVKRRKEIENVKSMEARAMAAALGHKSQSSGATSLTAKELEEVLSRTQGTKRSGDDKVRKDVTVGEDALVDKSFKKKKKKEKKKKKKKEHKRGEGEKQKTKRERTSWTSSTHESRNAEAVREIDRHCSAGVGGRNREGHEDRERKKHSLSQDKEQGNCDNQDIDRDNTHIVLPNRDNVGGSYRSFRDMSNDERSRRGHNFGRSDEKRDPGRGNRRRGGDHDRGLHRDRSNNRRDQDKVPKCDLRYDRGSGRRDSDEDEGRDGFQYCDRRRDGRKDTDSRRNHRHESRRRDEKVEQTSMRRRNDHQQSNHKFRKRKHSFHDEAGTSNCRSRQKIKPDGDKPKINSSCESESSADGDTESESGSDMKKKGTRKKKNNSSSSADSSESSEDSDSEPSVCDRIDSIKRREKGCRQGERSGISQPSDSTRVNFVPKKLRLRQDTSDDDSDD